MKNLGLYEEMIYLGSAVISLLLALVISTLRRTAKIEEKKEWTGPFILTFFVLALGYFLRFLNFLSISKGISQPFNDILKASILICSGVTNYLLFRAGFGLLDEPWLVTLKNWLTGSTFKRIAFFSFLCLLALIPYFSERAAARIPDTIFSVLALLFVGFGLYKNISYRHHKVMAWVALVSSIGYALVIILYGLARYFSRSPDGLTQPQTDKIDLAAFLIALPIKFAFFFPGYSLMLLISSPVENIEQLLLRVTQRKRGYLESNGIVKSICDALGVKEIQLHIIFPRVAQMSPRVIENQVALLAYPPPTDSEDKEPQISNYEENTDYDKIIKTRDVDITYSDNHWMRRRVSRMTVPVFFDSYVIATLKAEIGEERFTQTDRDKLKEIAKLISSLVQAYREVHNLNDINQKLAQLQIAVKTYDIEQDVDDIAAVVHRIICPLATGISIKAGFSEYSGVAPLDGEGVELMRKQLEGELSEENQTSNLVRDWPRADLKIAYNTKDAEKKQPLGEFIVAPNIREKKQVSPTPAINVYYLNDVSKLLSDTLLDFIRGYLNQLTDDLGVRLGGLHETNPEEWIRKVDKTAKQAKLLWVVASYSANDKMLGEDKKAIELVSRLERSPEWRKEDVDSTLSLWSRNAPEDGTWHVVEKTLKDSNQTLWFGVARRDFGVELSYISPWRFFIDQFCKIAEAALLRILSNREAEERKKEWAEFQGLATAAITTGTVIHQLVNHVRSLTGPINVLEVAIKSNDLRVSDYYKTLILSLRQNGDKIDEVLKQFAGVIKPGERQPCYLHEAVEQARELLEDSLKRYGIKFDSEVSKEIIIDVPFYVAVAALTNVVHNAKDAIRDGHIKNGLIRIRVEETDDMFLCHITDNGLGVSPSAQRMLFKSVYKSDKPYSHGLGLYFSARSLQQNRGGIFLTHPGPESGTTFSIQFPKLRNTL